MKLDQIIAEATKGPFSRDRHGDIVDANGDQLFLRGVALPCGNHERGAEAVSNGDLLIASSTLLPLLLAERRAREAYDASDIDDIEVYNCWLKAREAVEAAIREVEHAQD